MTLYRQNGAPATPDDAQSPLESKSLPRVYVLGMKRRGEDHYGLTTWMGDLPKFFAAYDRHMGCWEASVKVKPLAVEKFESDIDPRLGYSYLGFGWLAHPNGKLFSQEEVNDMVAKGLIEPPRSNSEPSSGTREEQ